MVQRSHHRQIYIQCIISNITKLIIGTNMNSVILNFNGNNGAVLASLSTEMQYNQLTNQIVLNGVSYSSPCSFSISPLSTDIIVDKSERGYSWEEVKVAVNRIFKIANEMQNESIKDDIVSKVYADNLPRAINKASEIAFMNNIDMSYAECAVLKNALEQLYDKGWIRD